MLSRKFRDFAGAALALSRISLMPGTGFQSHIDVITPFINITISGKSFICSNGTGILIIVLDLHLTS
jgi:hypothetical protein